MATSIIKRTIPSINGQQLYGTLYTNNFRYTPAYSASMSTSTSIPNTTAKTFCGLTLPAGVYFAGARASWASNSAGSRRVRIVNSEGTMIHNTCQVELAATNAALHVMLNCFLILSTSYTIYLEVHQNSGSSINLTYATLQCRRLR